MLSAGGMLCFLQSSLEFCSQNSVCLQAEQHAWYVPVRGTLEEKVEEILLYFLNTQCSLRWHKEVVSPAGSSQELSEAAGHCATGAFWPLTFL